MFCGGSFRCKTIDKNDQYKLVKLNGSQIKILRSSSVVGKAADGGEENATATGSTNRRIFLVQNKSVSLHRSVCVHVKLLLAVVVL